MNVPSGENFEMRPTASGVGSSMNCALCDSETKMLPSGAITTSFGSVKAAGGAPVLPPVPSTSSTLPSGLNLVTVFPLFAQSGNFFNSSVVGTRESTTQTFPCLSTSMPCGQRIWPAPNIFRMLPFESNLMIGSTVEPAHELLPQRSAAQTLLPSGSMSTALTEPHLRPFGSGPKLRTVSYGFGRKLTGLTADCSGGAVAPRGLAAGAAGACAGFWAESDTTMATAVATVPTMTNDCFILHL